MKRIFAVMLCLVLLIGCASFLSVGAAKDNSKDGLEDSVNMLIAGNKNLSLYVNIETADFCVLDKRTNKKWTSSCENAGSDKSLLNITYSGENNLSILKGSDNSDVSFELFQLKSGFKTVFSVSADNSAFEVPIKVELEKESIKVTVLYKDIKESGEGKILNVSAYPNFGLGMASQKGYAFIPDGSGAIIDYKDAESKNETYSGRVYGDDPSENLIYKENNERQTVKLPVFGVKQGRNAFLAVMENCEEFGSINASVSGGIIKVNPSFIYHESDLTGIQQSDGGARTMTIVQSKHVSENPEVSYYFLNDADASYSGMARKYREYLEENGILNKKVKKETSAASYEVFGAASEFKKFFGIKFKKMIYATTFDELNDFKKNVNDAGIKNASYYLYGFLSGGYEGSTVTSADYLRKLGGKKGYEKFVSSAGKDNVYTAFDIMHSYGRLFDFFRANDYTKSLNQTVVELHYKNLANGKWDTDLGSYKYYNVKKQQKLFSKLIRKLKSGSNIVISHMGEELPSDFAVSKPVNRDAALNFYNQVFEKCKSKNIGLGFESGNVYTVSSAKEITEAPLCSSNLRIESYSIPFYTMVFHGYKNISSTAVNDESNKKEFMLNAFSQGVSATWRIAGCDGYLLKETKLNFLYNADIDYVLKNSATMAEDYGKIHSVLFDKCIVEYTKNKNISITRYDNGWKIVCNFGKKSANYRGKTIKPYSYVVIK